MKPEDLHAGKRYVINSAPLIASPQRAESTFIGLVHHVNNDRPYVIPLFGSPLYVSAHWFDREARPEEV